MDLVADDSTVDFSHVFQFHHALLQAYDLGMSSCSQALLLFADCWLTFISFYYLEPGYLIQASHRFDMVW